jgi:glycerate kinase
MKILIAPNAFKGSLKAREVARAISEGLAQASPSFEPLIAPIADGGEGTVEILTEANQGEYRECEVQNAIGKPITARYGILPGGRTAVLEMAAASGLGQLAADELSPMKASSFGTGQLIKDALDQGCRRIILGLGGSATSDAGTGILQALGLKILTDSGYEVPLGGGGLAFAEKFDLSGLDPRLKECEFILPCDVNNPLLGEEGAARVYSPQKGATPEQVDSLEENLNHFAGLVSRFVGKDIGSMPQGGAAGGTSAGLYAFLNVRLISGIDFLLHQIGFDEKLREASFLITAEGRLDQQSLEGKGPYGVARRAARRQVPTLCLTGQLPPDFDPARFPAFQAIFPIPTRPMDLETAMSETESLLRFSAWQIGKMLLLQNR